MVADDRGVFFTTPHWNGYNGGAAADPGPRAASTATSCATSSPSAWLTRAQKRVAKAWLAEQGIDEAR